MVRIAKVPHSVRLTLTDRCNLHCDFCFIDASNKSGKEELSTQEWLKFFERLKELKVFNISLSGGEIFLRDDLFVLLEKLRGNRMHRLSLLTNGTLITKEISEKLSKLKIKSISISLDGMEKEHDRIRGKGSFKKSIKGIQFLINEGIIPQVAFTPIKRNYKDLSSLIDFIKSLGLSMFRVNTLSPEGRCVFIYKDIVLEYPRQIKEVLDVVENKRKQYPDLTITCQLGFHYHLPESYKLYRENPSNFEIKHLKDGCGAASTSCTITPSGDVIPCDGLADFIGGNIKNQDIMEIWKESKNFRTIRELGKVSMDRTPHCKECKYIYLCDGGCRASAYIVYNDLCAPGITCPFWKKKN